MFNVECGVFYCLLDVVEVIDIVLKFDLLIVYVDELSVLYLEDVEIDFVIDQLGFQLMLKVFNVKMCKVVDDVLLMECVEYMLQLQINLQFVGYGGCVLLMEIIEDGYVIL